MSQFVRITVAKEDRLSIRNIGVNLYFITFLAKTSASPSPIFYVKTALAIGFLVLTGSSPALALDVKDILKAMDAVQNADCQGKRDAPCEVLKKKIATLRSKTYEKALETWVTSMNAIGNCPSSEDLEKLVLGWANAAEPLEEYEPASVMLAIHCVEDDRQGWIEECQAAKHSGQPFLPQPKSCKNLVVRSTKDQKNHSIEIILSADCAHLFLGIGNNELGKGNYKTGLKVFEYTSWQDLVYLKFHKPYHELTAEEQEEVDREIEFSRRLQGKAIVGITQVFHASPTAIVSERHHEVLGKETKPYRPMTPNAWPHVASQLNSALATLHHDGIIYQDSKGQNTLISNRNAPGILPTVKFTDWGLSRNIREECEQWKAKGVPFPKRAAEGTPLTLSPELWQTETWPSRNCQEVERLAQAADVFTHASIIYRLFNDGQVLPWNQPHCTKNDDKAHYIECSRKEILLFAKDNEKVRKGREETLEKLLAEALYYENKPPTFGAEKRPTAREFQTRFDALMKTKMMGDLKNTLPHLRAEFHSDEHAVEALKEKKHKYLPYIETSPSTGNFVIKLAYSGLHGKGIYTLQSNPYDVKAVAKEIKQFEKENSGIVSVKRPLLYRFSAAPPQLAVLPPLEPHQKVGALRQAIENNNLKLADQLLARPDIDVNENYGKGTPLLEAIKLGKLDLAFQLLKAGANPNLADIASQTTPLALATESNNLAAVQLLTLHGAHPDPESKGLTPLMVAIQSGSKKMIEALLKAGANPHRETGGDTLVDRAIRQGNTSLVRLFLENGLSLNQTHRGITPLTRALLSQHSETIETLVEATLSPKFNNPEMDPTLKRVQENNVRLAEIFRKNKISPFEDVSEQIYTALGRNNISERLIQTFNKDLILLKNKTHYGSAVDKLNTLSSTLAPGTFFIRRSRDQLVDNKKIIGNHIVYYLETKGEPVMKSMTFTGDQWATQLEEKLLKPGLIHLKKQIDYNDIKRLLESKSTHLTE